MLDPTFAKLVAWYDNEWGYSCKICEMAQVVSK
jgi:glyceraldehyde 3-phosphate dehydrogenase